MVLLFILVGVFLIAGGGINYVCAIINKKRRRPIKLPGLFIAFFADTVILTVVNIILLRNPQFIYRGVHWGWVLGLNIGMFVLAIVMGILLIVKQFPLIMANSQFLLGACALTLMIFGLSLSHKAVYKFSKAEDFKVMANLPSNEDYAYKIKITNDIDFSGVKVNKGFGSTKICYLIDGQGHSLKNIDYHTTIKSISTTFLKMGSADGVSSKISNVTFENCTFTIKPHYYSSYSHEGEKCGFYIFSKTARLVSVRAVEVTVYVQDATPELKHEGKSSIGLIYPNPEQNDGYNFDISVVKETDGE